MVLDQQFFGRYRDAAVQVGKEGALSDAKPVGVVGAFVGEGRDCARERILPREREWPVGWVHDPPAGAARAGDHDRAGIAHLAQPVGVQPRVEDLHGSRRADGPGRQPQTIPSSRNSRMMTIIATIRPTIP